MQLKHGQFRTNFAIDFATLLVCGETAYLKKEDFLESMELLGETSGLLWLDVIKG